MPQANMVGRQNEQAEINQVLNSVVAAKGALLLLAGEAGVGKTRLAEECLTHKNVLVVKGAASETATPAYGPITTILRALIRSENSNIIAGCNPLIQYLAPLIPELGRVPDEGDQATLFEAIRCVIITVARSQPVALFLDDLQWADNATLELLPVLAEALRQESVLILGAYRSDEIPRRHPVRRLRNELRRAKLLHEIVVRPFDYEDTGQLAEQLLVNTVSDSLKTILYNHTQGMPLFVEELATTLAKQNLLVDGPAGLDLEPGQGIPIPDTLRDAVLLRLDGLSDEAIKLIEMAAVAGLLFDLELIINLTGEERALDELINRSLIVTSNSGQAAFRHALTREAIYEDILWTRCRTLHRQLAAYLEAEKAPAELVAEHWLAGRETDKARRALLVSARNSCDIHAYRDAAEASQRALELWPEGHEEALRLRMLDQLGRCAQLCGMLPDAVRAWREAAAGWQQRGEKQHFAETQRHLANVYELQGAWERALAARQNAADSFAEVEMQAEAAVERLAAASYLTNAANHYLALELIAIASQEIDQVDRPDLRARVLALEGVTRAKLGQFEWGRDLVQTGLSVALENNLFGPANDAYQKLGTVYKNAADYVGAKETYQAAYTFCETQGAVPDAHGCQICLVTVMVETGEWQQAISLCQELLASADADTSIRLASSLLLGTIYALRGETKHARNRLISLSAEIQRSPVYANKNIGIWGLAMVHEQEGRTDLVLQHCRSILEQWEKSDDRHYAVPALRWAATFFGSQGVKKETQACAAALSQIADENSNPETLAAFAHVLGEDALLNDNARQATQHYGQALNLLSEVEYPVQRVETELRAGVAFVAAGEQEEGIKHLVNAHRIARKLGARPIAAKAAQALTKLGKQVNKHLNPRAARRLKNGGLTRRQREVVYQIALGKTNQKIADELVLSPRTIDMHVGNILARLDCRTRTEAVHKARELGLLDSS